MDKTIDLFSGDIYPKFCDEPSTSFIPCVHEPKSIWRDCTYGAFICFDFLWVFAQK